MIQDYHSMGLLFIVSENWQTPSTSDFRVRFPLTTCGTGMGCGAMGAGLHCVVDMVLFCQFWPPVSFFSPGWLHCMSGLETGQAQRESGVFCMFTCSAIKPVSVEVHYLISLVVMFIWQNVWQYVNPSHCSVGLTGDTYFLAGVPPNCRSEEK